MKKFIVIALTLVMVVTLVACGGSGAKMTMGTGGTAGTYYGYGGVLGQYIKNNAGIIGATIDWEKLIKNITNILQINQNIDFFVNLC